MKKCSTKKYLLAIVLSSFLALFCTKSNKAASTKNLNKLYQNQNNELHQNDEDIITLFDEISKFNCEIDYNNFEDSIVKRDLYLPILENMVPQGICISDNHILISAYNYKGNTNSCIYVLDENGTLCNTCTLDNKAHVGGIAYDECNNLIWVTGENGNIDAYNCNDIISKNNAVPLYKDIYVGEELVNYKGKNSVAYITIHNNNLFLGNYTKNQLGTLKEYSFSIDPETNKLSLVHIQNITVPDTIQGLSFYEKDEKTYILFSRSYGRYNPSVLQIFEYDKKITNYCDPTLRSVLYNTPSMMEQIATTEEGLYTIYESNAKPYSLSLTNDNITQNIYVSDPEILIEPIK